MIKTYRKWKTSRKDVKNTQKNCLFCTEELYQKVLSDLDNHDGVVIHPEPDILGVKPSGP